MNTTNATQTLPTLYKNTRFDMLMIGEDFTSELVGPSRYVKTSARKAQLADSEELRANTDSHTEFNVKPSTQVTVIDVGAEMARDEFLSKPLFDGTEASCKTRQDFYALSSAMDDVITATTKLDEMADYVARKMSDIKQTLRRNPDRGGAVELEVKDRFSRKFSITPAAAAVEFFGLNSCGELQGNGNVDMLVATLIAKRETFKTLVNALGYRLSNVEGGR